MRERMQKTINKNIDCPQRNSTECERYEGEQTLIGITENNLTEVIFTKEKLMELIFNPYNMNKAYLQVRRNKGAGGIDGMQVEDLLPYLKANKDKLIKSLMNGKYCPNPVRRVEIPKDNGKKRQLGIPTVVDRVIQQAISQYLIKIYDKTFSPRSYGFRPGRGCHNALLQVKEYVNRGNKYVVSIDLEKFFDTVNQSKLIELLSRTIKDGRLISLIHKYLKAGVIVSHKFEESTKGVPQGGPLSPLLSNIMLDELDKELESRGHSFVRYADDCMILCKSRKAAKRTKDSIIKFIERKLYLKVNKEKTNVCYISKVKYLGYAFYISKGECRLRPHPKSLLKMKARLKELTSRSNGMGYGKRKLKLRQYIIGWIGYYKLGDMKAYLVNIDKWLRRRIRMCIWKCWKKVRTRFTNLQKCGINKQKSWEWSNTRKSYWRISGSPILSRALNNNNLQRVGYIFLSDYYSKVYRK
ncbi:MAG: group II intron reverse transcriptase/maturase [Candidatus Paceibacterota bacterium]